MKQTPKNIAQRLIAASASIRYTVDGWFYQQQQTTLRVLESLRKEVSGGPIIVVGNGPSLNATPLDDFRNIPAIGMNKIDLFYPRTTWRPSLIVCENDLVVRQNRFAFKTSEIPVFLAWKSRWFMGKCSNPNLHYFRGRATDEFSRDVTQWVAGLGWTVTYTALQFAYFLGGNPVVLFGIDHRFDTQGSGIARRAGADVNHFDPNYFAPGQHWGLPDLEASEMSYRVAKMVFEEDGRQILDATIDGNLQVFCKIDLQEARSVLG